MSSHRILSPAIIGEKTQGNQGIQANLQYMCQLSLLPHTQFQRIRHGMLRKIFSAPSLKPLIILSMPISPIIADFILIPQYFAHGYVYGISYLFL